MLNYKKFEFQTVRIFQAVISFWRTNRLGVGLSLSFIGLAEII